MNDEQKEIAEKIITEMKNNEGTISINSANRFRGKNDIHIILNSLVDDFKIIDRYGIDNFRLNENGYDFISFSELENKKILDKERNKIEFDLAKSNILANKLNAKNSKRNLVFAIINIIIGLLNVALLIWR